MANRAWSDGPTWEELRSAVRCAAFRAQHTQFGLSTQRVPAYEYLSDALCITEETAIKLCRACGYDPTTGWWIEEERC